MTKPSCFLIMDAKTRVDYTPKEIRALSFDQVEEDGSATVSWIVKTASDQFPEMGDTIVIRLTYPKGLPAPLFRGEVADRVMHEDGRSLHIICKGVLGAL